MAAGAIGSFIYARPPSHMKDDFIQQLDPKIVSRINMALAQIGERERLKELLRRKLEESGWTARVKQQCERKPPEKPFEPKFIDYIEEAKNLNADTLSPQDIADRVAPVARAAVPERVQQEMLVEIKRFLDNNI